MSFDALRRLFAWLADATADQVGRFTAKLTFSDLLQLDAWFELWAHQSQLPPKGEGWRVWLMMAGRGFGKTRAGAEWIYRLANSRPGVRIALVGATIADARAIMVEGVSGLLAVAKHHQGHLNWEPSLGRLKWPNCSEAQLFSGDNADGLRGPEHDFAWVLTFEVVADEAPPPIGALLKDASAGVIDCDEATSIGGYAAIGGSIRDAVGPIVQSYGIDLVEWGSILRSPSTTVGLVTENDLGNSPDGAPVPRLERTQMPSLALPSSLSLAYYDPQRDYQAGLSQSDVVDDRLGTETKIELPAVLSAGEARGIAEDMMARGWAQRDKLVLRLPPRFVALEPGQGIELAGSPVPWQVQRSTIEGMVAVVELKPSWRTQAALAADPGRALQAHDIVAGELSIALVELPDATGEPAASGMLYLAASTPTAGWKPVPIEVSCGSFVTIGRTANRKAALGHAVTLRADDSVEIELIDEGQWLMSCDEDAIAAGANFALIGDELVQFADVQPLGSGRFRLTRLSRGRAATEWAMASHQIGELFLLVDEAALQPIALPTLARGSSVRVTEPATGASAKRSLRRCQQLVGNRDRAVAEGPAGT